MKVSSAYLYEQLSNEFTLQGGEGLSGRDGYLRPFFVRGNLEGLKGHVCVLTHAQAEQLKLCNQEARDNFWVICVREQPGQKASEQKEEEQPGGTDRTSLTKSGPQKWPALKNASCVQVLLKEEEDAALVLNALQQIFDRCDAWEHEIHTLLATQAGMTRILEVTSEFLGNPLMVMGLDFTLMAEAGADQLPPSARLFHSDGINIEYMNALLQDEGYQKLAKSRETTLFPAYISGCRSMNRNLYVEGIPTHRLVLTECKNRLSAGYIGFLENLADSLEVLLAHVASAPASRDMEQIFERILSDRTADYIQISHQLSALGWSASHSYFCLVLQITYLNQKQLSTRAICRHIKKQFPDSISFLYKEEIVTFFNLGLLGVEQEEVSSALVYFIRDSYLKAGYSRTMEGHMNLRRQYVQARVALDVGSRKKPYLWIHHFNQVALTYLMEQSTRRLPGNMLCHEGLLSLKQSDEKNHTEYVRTLKAYLDEHLSATQAAKALFIHRSTFLYRLERIREIFQSDLDDPEEIFYLELSIRLLEQDEEKK